MAYFQEKEKDPSPKFDWLSFAQTQQIIQKFDEEHGNLIRPEENSKPTQRSIFGQIVVDRQKRREGDVLSDEGADVKPLIYEEEQDFDQNAQMHRPKLIDSFVDDYFGPNGDFEIPNMSPRRNVKMERRNTLQYNSSRESEGSKEVVRRSHSPQAPPQKTNSIKLENFAIEQEDKIQDDQTNGASGEIANNVIVKRSESQIHEDTMYDHLMLRPVVSQYKKFKKEQPLQQKISDNENIEVNSNSSQSNLSDQSYNPKNYTLQDTDTSHQQTQQISTKENENNFAGVGSAFLDEILKTKRDTAIIDLLQIVNISEYTFQGHAQRKLQDSKAISIQTAKVLTQQQRQTQLVVQRVMAGPKTMKQLTQGFARRQNEGIKSTCVALSEYSVIIGTSAGYVFVYDKDTEKFHSVYREESKDFKDNAITCIDVHPLRHEYVVTGHQRGQLVLLDLTKLPQESQQNVKCIKDHHSQPVVSVKFCDWIKERPINQDKPAWMIISCDIQGTIVISRISSIAFRILTVEKMYVINSKIQTQIKLKEKPQNTPTQQYTLAAKFHSTQYPQLEVNDNLTLIAIGSVNEVSIEFVEKERNKKVLILKRPKNYVSENQQRVVTIEPVLPCLSWGYGRTPCFKDQTYCILAIAWGPLIQTVCIKDLNAKPGEDIFVDGSYIIASSTMYKQSTPGEVADSFVQSINFVDESLLLVTLSNADIRVLYTKNFYPGAYRGVNEKDSNFNMIDNRIKLSSISAPLTKEQQEVELERRTYLEYPIQTSMFGGSCSQTIQACGGRAVLLSTAGIFKLIHLTWEQSLGNIEPQILNGNSWIDIFAKTLEIYLGKVKGLKGVPDDDHLRQFMMKGQMKVKIGEILEIVISSWKKMAQQSISQQQKTSEQAKTELNRNYQTLMRIIIELTVEIDEADYLFTDIYQRFKDEDCGEMFATEIKPYILNGLFAEWDAPEEVLNFHVLQYHQQIFQEAYYGQNTSPKSGLVDHRQVSPAENFEKIMINLNFNTCSKNNIQDMIEFCKKYRLSTGAFYLYISTAGEKGPVLGLNVLRDFYFEALKEESHKNFNGQRIGLKEIRQLINMPASASERLVLERSSIYQGLKLLWATRLIVEGKRFPKGKLERPEWQKACQTVLKHITERDFIKTMCSIDAGAFFQILSIPFNTTQIQHNFFLKGEPVTHQTLIQNASTYCLQLSNSDPVRVSFLCFISSISNTDLIKQDRLFFHNTTLELLQNYEQLISFNNELLQRQTHSKLCKILSVRAQKAAPEMRGHILSEDQLMQLIRNSEQLTQENILELVNALVDTSFDTLKILIYEKQEDYSKCLQLQLEHMKKYQSDFQEQNLQDCFTWIIKVHYMLERRIKDWDDASNNRQNFQSFQREVLRCTDQLTQIDTHKTVGLCDAIFKSDHEQMILKLQENPTLQYSYVSKLIELKTNQIKECVNAQTQQKDIQLAAQAQSWTRILSMHVRLTSKLYPEKLVPLIKVIGKENYYPVEECLKICNQSGNLEAQALLSLEIGSYQESILLYLKLLERDLNVKQLRQELYYLASHRRTKLTKLPSVELFQNIIGQLKRIIHEHPEEVLQQNDVCWYKILETVSQLSLNQHLMRKSYCKQFIYEVLQQFCRQLLQYVGFNHIVESYIKAYPLIRYREIFTVIKEVFQNTCSTKLQCEVTEDLTLLDCKDLEDSFLQEKIKGLLFREIQCGLCYDRVDQQKDQVVLFECQRSIVNHAYHQHCLAKWASSDKRKNKKALSKEAEDRSIRCPVCNKKNWDISGDQVQKTYKLHQQRHNDLSQGLMQTAEATSVQSDQTKKSSQSGSSSGNSYGQLSSTFQVPQIAATQVQKKLDLQERRQMEKLKKMKNFDQDFTQNILNIDNFKLSSKMNMSMSSENHQQVIMSGVEISQPTSSNSILQVEPLNNPRFAADLK